MTDMSRWGGGERYSDSDEDAFGVPKPHHGHNHHNTQRGGGNEKGAENPFEEEEEDAMFGREDVGVSDIESDDDGRRGGAGGEGGGELVIDNEGGDVGDDIEVGQHGSINADPKGFDITKPKGEQNLNREGDPTIPESGIIVYEPFWKRVLFAFFPSKKKEVRPWLVGVLLDAIFMLCLITLIISIYNDRPEKIREAWYFPFLGVFGAIISTSTPAGGGVVFFPFLTLINYTSQEAAAFSLMVQAVSMGIFGAAQWARTAPRGVIIYWMILVIVAGSWGGVLVSLVLLPIDNDGALRTFFLGFIIFLALYILYGMVQGALQKQDAKLHKNIENILVFLFFGFIGGMIIGYIAVGIDILFFIILTAVYKTSSNVATVGTIYIMGWACWLPAIINLVAFSEHVRVNFVLMTLVGSLIGARIGPGLNLLAGRRNVLIAFEVLLLIEILRTIGELFIAPAIFSGSEYFWNED